MESQRDGLPQNRIKSDLPQQNKHKRFHNHESKIMSILFSVQNWKIKNADSC